MRAPATINDWLSDEEMARWVDEATDSRSHQRRMAIRLTRQDRLYAHEVAHQLGVSVQAVWLWIRQYNNKGPAGLARKGRGGRHWGLLTPKQEEKLLAPYLQKARAGEVAKPCDIKVAVEKHLKKKVSMSYIYRLLQRHGWAEILAQSHGPETSKREPTNFVTLASPWQRESNSD